MATQKFRKRNWRELSYDATKWNVSAPDANGYRTATPNQAGASATIKFGATDVQEHTFPTTSGSPGIRFNEEKGVAEVTVES